MSNDRKITPQVGVLKALINRARLVWRLLRDPRVPIYLKALPIAAALYIVSPADFVPDLAPLLGQLDDLGVLLVGIESFIALCPPHVVQEHRAQIEGGEFYSPTDAGRTRESEAAQTIDGEWRVK
ncbi:MAG: DUF1232 domain-containing protein [Thermoflexales bacterium]|nr:DUF1232 domain-containing protein [Thermoflexales bacterium]MDW8351033.1 DUF1232 domain-containing protein [Anaerolineae bacterium]